jgi:hypothetical protein
MKNHQDKVENYRYLWENSSGRYVLIQTDKSRGQEMETCLVYDLETKAALLEEDDDVYREVKTRLAGKGVPVLLARPVSRPRTNR